MNYCTYFQKHVIFENILRGAYELEVSESRIRNEKFRLRDILHAKLQVPEISGAF